MYLVTRLMQTLTQTICCTQLCSASDEVGLEAPQDSTATENCYYAAAPQQCLHKRRKTLAFSVR